MSCFQHFLKRRQLSPTRYISLPTLTCEHLDPISTKFGDLNIKLFRPVAQKDIPIYLNVNLSYI